MNVLNVLNVFSIPLAVKRFEPEDATMRSLGFVALLLVVVGALNWGLVGIAQFDLVAAIFGGQSAPLARVVYSLVGLSGLAVVATQLTRAPVPQRS
jgi:uncharacterized protein